MYESNRLRYEQWKTSDFHILKTIIGNPKVCEYLPGPHEKTDEDIQKWLDYFVKSFGVYHNTYIFKISHKDNLDIIGYGGVAYVKEFDKHEIMYGINEDYWGQGYGTEISMRMKELAKELGHNNIIALADVNNVASKKILVKTGFTPIKEIHLWGLHLQYYEMEL